MIYMLTSGCNSTIHQADVSAKLSALSPAINTNCPRIRNISGVKQLLFSGFLKIKKIYCHISLLLSYKREKHSLDLFLSIKFLVLREDLWSSRRILPGKDQTRPGSESCSFLQCKELRSSTCSGTWSTHHGLRISKDETFQCYSSRGVEQSEQALSDCSAELYLNYLRVSKISLRKECSKPACKER